MTIKTPERVAKEYLDGSGLDHLDEIDEWEHLERIVAAAIEADRAQRIDGQTTIPTEDEWEESERKRLGLTAEEWAEATVDEDWGNPRPVIVMWGDSQETPGQRLQRFHEEILAISRERYDREGRIREALRVLNEEVGA